MSRTLYIFDQGLKGQGGHYYEYVRSIVEAAPAAGIRCVVGCHEQAGDGSFASFELHPVFRDDVWPSLAGEDQHSDTTINGVGVRFIEDLHKVLRKHPVQPGDIVFLPNIAKPHIVAAAMVAEEVASMGARTHLMFRYPSSHFQGDTAAQAFRRIEKAAGKYEVSLCTDSHRLADNLASLTSLPFAVFPIPHTWQGQENRNSDGPLHCVSLGNARDEKGMAEILEAVRLSSTEPWGNRLRFTLQVNDPYQVRTAIEAFRAGPVDPRTLLLDRRLNSDEYAALLGSADVVLVPYWRSIYRERTSGVFVEALVAGKLVLCTRDTWMSDLLDLHGGGVVVDDRSGIAVCEGLRELIERRVELQQRSRQAAEHWKSVHCRENFLVHLVCENAPPTNQLSKRGKAAVIFPWGEAISGKTGASLRLKYFVRFMESVYDEVRILFTGGGEAGGIIGKRSVATPSHYSQEARQLQEQLKAVCRMIGAPEDDCFHLWYHLWPAADDLFALRCEEMVLWADHIYVDYTYFVPLIDKLTRQHGKSYTVTMHDIVSDQSTGTPFLHHSIRALEFDAARMAQRVVCVSESDRAILKAGGVEADVIPHAIDVHEAVSAFSSEEACAILEDLYDLPLAKKRLCFFVGSLYRPNIDAAKAIADMARQCLDDSRLDDVIFVVAGSCMEPCRTGNFVALGIIEDAALSACMSLADVILVPLLSGTGVSLKTVEALARGSLLLSTSTGVRGLDVKDGIHCYLEDDLSLFPERIVEILMDPKRSEHMRKSARDFGANYDFRRLMPRYIPGAAPVNESELDEDLAARREDAIKGLLPRLRRAVKLSPPLAAWMKEYQDVSAVTDKSPSNGPPVPGGWPIVQPEDVLELVGFDAKWYRVAYPDVAMLEMDAAEHYIWIGRALGRAPNANRKKKVLSTTP